MSRQVSLLELRTVLSNQRAFLNLLTLLRQPLVDADTLRDAERVCVCSNLHWLK